MVSLAVSRRISNLYSSLTRLTIWFFDSKAHSEKRRRRAQPLIFGHKKTPHCCEVFGGVEDGSRTHDLLNHNQAL